MKNDHDDHFEKQSTKAGGQAAKIRSIMQQAT
jgi:hypothetical protein